MDIQPPGLFNFGPCYSHSPQAYGFRDFRARMADIHFISCRNNQTPWFPVQSAMPQPQDEFHCPRWQSKCLSSCKWLSRNRLNCPAFSVYHGHSGPYLTDLTVDGLAVVCQQLWYKSSLGVMLIQIVPGRLNRDAVGFQKNSNPFLKAV